MGLNSLNPMGNPINTPLGLGLPISHLLPLKNKDNFIRHPSKILII